MGDAKDNASFSLTPTLVETSCMNIATFKQNYGETLKDAWFRINKIHKEDPNPCEEKLHLYYYNGLDPWYKSALDLASGGSFILISPTSASLVIKNLYGINTSKINEK
jgi:hypothetical protein